MTDPRMGLWGIPGTFPTGLVFGEVVKSVGGIESAEFENWSRDKVNNIFYAYKKGVRDGIYEIYPNADIVDQLSADLKLSVGDVRKVLFAMLTLVKSGDINPYFLNFSKSSDNPFEEMLPNLGNWFDKYFTSIKWVAGAVIVGGLAYISNKFVPRKGKN